MKQFLKSLTSGTIAGLALFSLALAQTASILPPPYTQYLDNNGRPLSGGKVFNYIPATTTPKTTWIDAAETTPNANPVVLDSAGRARIFGEGSYRQILRTSANVQVWDGLTSSTGSGSGGVVTVGDGVAVGMVFPYSGLVAPANYAFAYGQTLSRTTYSALFAALTLSSTAVCQSGLTTITGLSDTSQIAVGMSIEAGCLAPGGTIASIIGPTSITVSAAATSSITTTAVVLPYGAGDGSTTFNLPDLRGRVFAGRDNMGGVAVNRLTLAFMGVSASAVGSAGGSQSHTMTAAELASHTHVVSGNTASDGTHTHTATAAGQSRFGGGGLNPGTFFFGSAGDTGLGGTATLTTSSEGAHTHAVNITSASSGSTAPFSVVQPTITTNYIIKIFPDSLSSDATWQVSQFCVPLGLGVGTGFGVACPATTGHPLVSNGASANPSFAGNPALASLTVGTGSRTPASGSLITLQGGFRLTQTNPTLNTIDYGFSTSNKTFAITTTVSGTGSGTGSGFMSQLDVLSSATDVPGIPAVIGQTRIAVPNQESYAVIGIMDWAHTGALGAGMASIMRNQTLDPGEPTLANPFGNTGYIAYSESPVRASSAFLASNSITNTNEWRYGLYALNPFSAVLRTDMYGSPGIVQFRRLTGSPSTPTAVLVGQTIGQLDAYGWGASAWSVASRASLQFRTNQTWTDANQGTSVFVRATRPNTLTTSDIARFDGDIPLSILQVVGDNQGQSLRLIPQYNNALFWDIWAPTSGALNIRNSSVRGIGITDVGVLFADNTIVSGVTGTFRGALELRGETSGAVTVMPQAAAGTYNFNLPTTAGTSGQILTSAGGGTAPMTWTTSGAGTVTSVSVVSANGFAGSVATATSTPAITLSTTVTGILSGNGTAISAATTTGSGSVVLATSPTLVTPVLGVATATSLNGVSYPSGGTSGGIPYFSSAFGITSSSVLGTNQIVLGGGVGVSPTSLASLGTTTTVLHGNAAGAPTFGAVSLTADVSGTLPVANGGTGVTTSTGSGNNVLSTSPTLVTPVLGAATATSVNGLTLTTTTGVLTIAAGKTLTASNTLTFTGTDGSSVALGTGGTVAYVANNLSVFAATTSAQLKGVISDETGTGGGLVFATAPALTGNLVVTAPAIGTSDTFTIAAAGNAATDVPTFRFTSLAGTVVFNQFGDAANGNFRLKALGDMFFHAGNVGVSATNEWFTVKTAGRLLVHNNEALTSGGAVELSLRFGLTQVGIFAGTGAPTIVAPKGSLYLRDDGSSTSTRLYVNTDGSTAWTNVTTGS